MTQATQSAWLLAATALLGGCALLHSPDEHEDHGSSYDYFHAVAAEMEFPDVHSPDKNLAEHLEAPRTVHDDQPAEYWNLTLQEAVQIALANSPVLRDLGAAVLRSPDEIDTAYDIAIQESEVRTGIMGPEAALSAFDAFMTTTARFANNDRALNNELLGGGTRLLKQELADVSAAIGKRSAVGTEMAIRHNINYDANNAPSNLFPHAYNVNLEVAARQPILQGAGSLFNRIAGPEVNGLDRDARRMSGDYNGVLIARIRTDIELTELEIALRDLASNVENAYWDLYFAYRDLHAKIDARDDALETWRRVRSLFEANRRGGEAWREAQAREQYFRFQEEVQNALTGRLIDGTRTNNGSRGGTFRGTGGVHVAERRLRLMMGIPTTARELIRPADEPRRAKIVFDWPDVTTEALARRTELRRQKWRIKQRELELVASRNFLLPRLDVFGTYRWRGFGESLIDAKTQPRPRFDNAYMDLTTGDFQEWELGVGLDFPFGFRKAHAGVRNAEHRLARERAVLDEQERQILHDLADVIADTERAHEIAQTNYNRRIAARQQLDAVLAAYEADKAPLDQLLNAQRRVVDSDIEYFRSLAEYALAVKNVHFEKGSLLDYNEIYLSEGPWPGKAYRDAARRERFRGRPHTIDYGLWKPPVISAGPVPQEAAFVPGEVVPPNGEIVPAEAPGETLPSPEANEPADAQPEKPPQFAPPEEMPAAQSRRKSRTPLADIDLNPLNAMRIVVKETMGTVGVTPEDLKLGNPLRANEPGANPLRRTTLNSSDSDRNATAHSANGPTFPTMTASPRTASPGTASNSSAGTLVPADDPVSTSSDPPRQSMATRHRFPPAKPSKFRR